MISPLRRAFMTYQKHPEEIDFQKYWLILKRHWLPATLVWGATISLAVLKALLTEEVYQAYGKLQFSKENATSALVTEAGEKIGTLDSLTFRNTPLDTEAEVIQSTPLVNQTIQELDLRDSENQLLDYEDFIENLAVRNVPGTDVLRVAYKSPDTQEAQQIVNKLMEIYLENNIRVNRAEAASAREFIKEQLPKIEAELNQAEMALRTFRERHQITNLETRKEVLADQMSELDSQFDQTRTRLSAVSARMAKLQEKTGVSAEQALQRRKLEDSTGVQEVLARLQEVESELAEEQSRFLDQNPMIINLKRKRDSLESLLDERVNQVVAQPRISREQLQTDALEANLSEQLVLSEVERQELQAQLLTLEQTRNIYQQRVDRIPQLEQIQRGLERQVDAAQVAYETLLNNLQQVQIAENQNVGNAQIINPATLKENPISTSRKMTVVAGIVAGGVLYLITAFLGELIDHSVKTSKELRSLFDYTLLGMIPNTRKKSILSTSRTENVLPERQVLEDPNSVPSEAYRMLQANLKFLSPDEDLKVIAVTSSVPKEGKSTVSTNLATAIAQLGNKVLLIDADLHQPQQHHIWQLTNQSGLSNVVVNNASLEDSIRSVIPNLDVLPSGSIPPQPLALLESQRLNSLMQQFKQDYDFVILDTPPLLLLADTLTVSKTADGILLVARPGVTTRVSATAARETLQKSGQRILGLVANGIAVEDEPDSSFYYARDYRKNKNTSNPLPNFLAPR